MMEVEDYELKIIDKNMKIRELKAMLKRQDISDKKYKEGDYEGFYKEELFVSLMKIQHLREELNDALYTEGEIK